MATTLQYRSSVPSSSFGDRRTSFSSFPASHNSTTSLTQHKLSSQASLVPQSAAANSKEPSRLDSPLHHDAAQPRPRRLRPQYPLESPERHVEYILVASFDIDRGPIMEHQYPGAISPDENMLAELMLPDQTHVRTQDWTMFFLHKDSGGNDDGEAAKATRRQGWEDKSPIPAQSPANGEDHGSDISTDESEDRDEDVGEGPPLMYVLNLVNTKQDNTVKRYVCPCYSQSPELIESPEELL